VLYVDHPMLAEPVADLQADALAQLVQARKPRAVLIPLTNVGLGVGTLQAEPLGLPVVNYCKNLRVVDGKLQAECIIYGGKIETTVTAPGATLAVALWPGARPADKGRAPQAPPIEDVTVVLPETPGVRLKRYVEPEAGDVDITQKDVLVAVGRGIQSQDNLGLAEELAAAMDGAVCGSRPVIDQGWLGLARQVGKSGLTVKPRIYLALGISGAPEHTEGMKDASMIVAVNTDPQAPIFSVAHYGIVADVLDVIPALTEAVKAREG
jgi:electron transfer flavoprotein alpha subunit